MIPLVEAAAQERVSYQKVLSLVITGAVKGQRVGKRWFADPASLARWKQQQGILESPTAA